jgi:spore maturation protein CgeB
MRIVIFGLTVSSSWGNGHATIWRGLCGALGASNHRVTFFEKDVSYYRAHRDLVDPAQYKLRLYTEWNEIEADARRELARADCAIVTSYCPDARAAAELIFSCHVLRRVFYDLDTPVTLRALAHTDVPYIPQFGLEPFDLVLSYTGGRALEELKSRLGARRVSPLYGCVDICCHRRVPPARQYDCDFSYLGTYAADRQRQLQALFLEPARKTPQKKFCIGGALYPGDFQWSDNMYFVRHLPPVEHAAFFSSSKLTLNITRAAMTDMGYCPSGRLFEAAACGTPIVSDYWEGLDQFFVPGDEILLANNSDDVINALNLDACKLQAIARAAQERVLAQHSAERRAAELINLLEG